MTSLFALLAASGCSSDDDDSTAAAGAAGSSGASGRGGAGQAGSAAHAGSAASGGNAGSVAAGGSSVAGSSVGGSSRGGEAGENDALGGAAGADEAGGTGGVAAAHCVYHTDAEGDAGAAGAAAIDVGVATSKTIGSYLTDAAGHTLYVFGSDVPGDCAAAPITACASAPCTDTWASFSAGARVLGGTLNDAEFGDFVPTASAKPQTTYHGWPLYTYVGDAPGLLTGQGIATLWHAVKLPFFNVMLMKKKLPDATTAKYISDGEGFALYQSTADSAAVSGQPAVSKCDAACSQVWPPFTLDRFILPSSFKDSDFSLFVRAGGTLQVAYRGRPLYRFASDKKPGDTLGHAVTTFKLADPAL